VGDLGEKLVSRVRNQLGKKKRGETLGKKKVRRVPYIKKPQFPQNLRNAGPREKINPGGVGRERRGKGREWKSAVG